MSNAKHVLIGLGIVALIVLVIKFRVAIIAALPFSDTTKNNILKNDPFTQFIDQKDTFQVINPNKVKEVTITPDISFAQIGLVGTENDSQKSVTDLKRELMEGDWVGITDKQLSDALFGKSEQRTTINENGIVETKLVQEDKLFGATFKQVEKEVSNVIDKVIEPFSQKGKVLTVQTPSSAQKVVLVTVINRFTGDISQVDAHNIPQGYVIVGA